jgi:hypothetical protein
MILTPVREGEKLRIDGGKSNIYPGSNSLA